MDDTHFWVKYYLTATFPTPFKTEGDCTSMTLTDHHVKYETG